MFNMSDVRHYLRKVEFPNVTWEALRHLQQIISYEPVAHQLLKDIPEEFVFFEIDRRGARRQKLTPMEELQVLEKICNYFGGPGNDRTSLFLYLFPPGSKLLDKRLSVLARLMSMSISIGNCNILACCGVLMQRIGCSSEASLAMAKTVLKDYFGTTSSWSTNETLKNLSSVVPLFCSCLITAFTHLFRYPTREVLEMILEWVVTSPTVCFIPLNLLSSYCRPQTPILGLLLWSILEPVSDDTSLHGGSNVAVIVSGKDKKKENINKFSSLHLAVLQSMVKIHQMKSKFVSYDVMPPPAILEILIKLKEKIQTGKVHPECVGIAIERFAQSLQVMLSTKCSQISQVKASGLFEKINELPYNRLLFIVVERWNV